MKTAGAQQRPVRGLVSAGGVVWRCNAGGGVEVVVCGRTGDGVWGLPKGTPDSGEPIEGTALREVREETGLEVRLGVELPLVSYWFVAGGFRNHKRVHYWLMEAVGGDVAAHDAEFDEVAWLAVDDAVARLSYRNEQQVVVAAVRLLGEAVR